MKHKFKAGDKVEIVRDGRGCHPIALGEVLTIKTLADDYLTDHGYENGYTVEEVDPAGHWNTPKYVGDYTIGESSFKLSATSSPSDRSEAPKSAGRPKNSVTREQLIDLVRYGAVLGQKKKDNWSYEDVTKEYEKWKLNLK